MQRHVELRRQLLQAEQGAGMACRQARGGGGPHLVCGLVLLEGWRLVLHQLHGLVRGEFAGD